MTLPRKIVLAGAAILMLALCVSASADIVVATSTDHMTGTGTIRDITCDSVVTRALNNVYTYTYSLSYTNGTSAVHTYRIQNPNGVAFHGAYNLPVGTGSVAFTNPPDATGWINWTLGTMVVGGTATFSYQSMYAPMLDIKGWEIAIDGGGSATGKTLVMGDTLPEPSSLAAFLFGAAGLVPMVIRRRK